MLQPERDLGAIQDGLAAWLRTRMPEPRDLPISARTHLVERPRDPRPHPQARLARARPRAPRRSRAWDRSDRSPARLLGALPRMDRTRPGAAADPRPRARLAPRAPLRAAPRRPVLGRRAPAQPDLPQRPGRRRPRLGDGVPRRPRGGP